MYLQAEKCCMNVTVNNNNEKQGKQLVKVLELPEVGVINRTPLPWKTFVLRDTMHEAQLT